MYNEIIKGLFVSGADDAITFREDHPEGIIICVLENLPDHEPKPYYWIPVLDPHSFSTIDNIRVNKQQKKLILNLINYHLTKGNEVLVHCRAGIERSPLVVACYLADFHEMSMEDAYKIVKERRPETMDRRQWL